MKITDKRVGARQVKPGFALMCALGLAPLGAFAAGLKPGAIAGNTVYLDKARGYVFCEFSLIMGAPPSLMLQTYNTSGQGQCDPAEFDPIDAKALAKQLGVDAVLKNPPRRWLMDRLWSYDAGQTYDFEGINATWMGSVKLNPEAVGGHGKPFAPYRVNVVSRKSKYEWLKGSQVYLLRSPDGKVFVMQSYTNLVDKNLTAADLPNLGTKLKLPPGWKYEAKTLEGDFTLIPQKSTGYAARALADDLENVYQGCGFDKSCSYIP
jgi:hypothetical protein